MGVWVLDSSTLSSYPGDFTLKREDAYIYRTHQESQLKPDLWPMREDEEGW